MRAKRGLPYNALIGDRLKQAIIPRLGRMLAPIGRELTTLHYRCDSWALRDVTFPAERDKAFGVMGRNDAGKSTYCRLSLEPSERGRLVARGDPLLMTREYYKLLFDNQLSWLERACRLRQPRRPLRTPSTAAASGATTALPIIHRAPDGDWHESRGALWNR